MSAEDVELQDLTAYSQGKTFLDLFFGLKWAFVVLCVSFATAFLVQPWFLLLGGLLSSALVVSDERVLMLVKKRFTRLLDSEFDAVEEAYSDVKALVGGNYLQLLAQAIEIYREIKAAVQDRSGMFHESFGDVIPAIQSLMEKIILLTRKAQTIDNGLRCHDDVERTKMVLTHYQKKIEGDMVDDFIRAEWIRTRNSLVKQLRSQEEILRGKEYVQSKLTNIVTSLREVHLSIIRLSFSDIQDGSDDLSGVFQTVMNLSEAIDDTVETLDRITYQQV
ncbi:hypothetical protein CSB45_08870 [candidate division KSB3 bacterium]|uniref:Uncharacterized protein n=1 Tax=candidate division KSB3 bacterium TaxID=2044937 RepID=A0A2G6E4M7_9BACT|nr:MAG: hypothetical protein CSB45_08870 [candidate division KSB3 bacterium]PIE29667.1 MAG: hypothetical protein CSA57_07560 [candidate division KSB3 bacterium]